MNIKQVISMAVLGIALGGCGSHHDDHSDTRPVRIDQVLNYPCNESPDGECSAAIPHTNTSSGNVFVTVKTKAAAIRYLEAHGVKHPHLQ
ncbi:hypothetical protein JKG47_00545 [Acidithiobacillus sp. MC6.1]|nr:hypothetical protein [Acidithiobacillus sp. MC6.1]